MEPSEDEMLESNKADSPESVTNKPNWIELSGDIEETFSNENDLARLLYEKQVYHDKIVELENIISEAKHKQHAQKIKAQSCDRKIREVQGGKVSRRDYMFGIVQKALGLFLPAMYAIYGTLILNFLLSLINAASDLSVFWWLLTANHPKTAYVLLGKLNVILDLIAKLNLNLN